MTTGNSPSELKIDGESAAVNEISADQLRQGQELSVLDILIVVAEKRRNILGITAILVICASLISFVLPVRYTASVTLLPPQQNSSTASMLASQLGNLTGMAALAGGGALGLKNPNDMFVAMLKSRTVEDSMVQHFGLMTEYKKRYLSDARKDFEAHTTVDGSGKDGLIHISIEDRDPKRAAELANGYVDQFRNLSQHLAITEASQRRLFFQRELEQAKVNLANAEEALMRTEQTTGLIQLDSQARALIESAATLRAQIAAKEVQIQGMQTYATGENAELVQADRELDSMRAQLAKLGSSESIGGSDIIIPRGKVTQAGLEYIRKLRDVKYFETIFDVLARQYEIAKLDEAKEGALIQVVDAAVPPDKRSFPKRGLIVIAAGISGLVIGFFYALAVVGLESLRARPDTYAKYLHLMRMFQWRSRSVAE